MLGLGANAKREIVAVADIGSSSVALAIVSLEHGKPAVILACHRTPVTIAERSGEGIASAMATGLDATTTAALSAAGESKIPRVSTVYAFIHAPWTHSSVAHAVKTYDTDIKVTESVIADIGKEALSASGRGVHDLFEASIVRVELNGYPTGAPVGKVAHRISASALTSTCEQSLYRAVDDTLARHFPDAARISRSGARAVVAVSNALSGKLGDSVILEIGGEASTVIVVRRGVLDDEELLSEGTHGIIRRIGGRSIEETMSTLHLIGQDICDSAACEAMNASLARIEPDLVRVFGERFAKLAAGRRLPNRLVLLAHPDMQSWLARFFARIDFTQFSVTSQPFNVVTLKPAALGHLVIAEGKLEPDSSLLVAVACAQIEQHRD